MVAGDVGGAPAVGPEAAAGRDIDVGRAARVAFGMRIEAACFLAVAAVCPPLLRGPLLLLRFVFDLRTDATGAGGGDGDGELVE